MKTATLYDRDLLAWADESARLLRSRSFDQLDVENIAEEIESLGANRKRELASRIEEIIEHLLKLQLAPDFEREQNGRLWRISIHKHRRGIEQLLEESPSLRAQLTEELLRKCYAHAARDVKIADFAMFTLPPRKCVYTWAEILSAEEENAQ